MADETKNTTNHNKTKSESKTAQSKTTDKSATTKKTTAKAPAKKTNSRTTAKKAPTTQKTKSAGRAKISQTKQKPSQHQYGVNIYDEFLNREIKVYMTNDKVITGLLVKFYTYELLLEKEISKDRVRKISIHKQQIRYVTDME